MVDGMHDICCWCSIVCQMCLVHAACNHIQHTGISTPHVHACLHMHTPNMHTHHICIYTSHMIYITSHIHMIYLHTTDARQMCTPHMYMFYMCGFCVLVTRIHLHVHVCAYARAAKLSPKKWNVCVRATVYVRRSVTECGKSGARRVDCPDRFLHLLQSFFPLNAACTMTM